MPKRRKPFILRDRLNQKIGYGTLYDEGNVQIYMAPHYSAWQMRLADVLLLDGVAKFEWKTQKELSPTMKRAGGKNPN